MKQHLPVPPDQPLRYFHDLVVIGEVQSFRACFFFTSDTLIRLLSREPSRIIMVSDLWLSIIALFEVLKHSGVEKPGRDEFVHEFFASFFNPRIPQRSVVMQRILVSLNTSALLLVRRELADHHHNSHPRGTGMISTRIGNNAVDCFFIKSRGFHAAHY